METARIAELAREHGLAEIADELAALARWGFRLEYAEGRPTIGTSKLGGMPDLPEGMDWPAVPRTGAPLCFVGQLNLAEFARDERWPGPIDGLLVLFCHKDADCDEVSHGEAVNVAAGERLARARTPTGLSPRNVFDEVAVTPRAEITIPSLAVDPAVALAPYGFDFGGPRESLDESYYELERALITEQKLTLELPDGRWPPRHRVLGHPRHIQGDVLVELVSSAREGHSTWEEMEARSLDWQLLLQVEADDRLGGGFADGGTIFFALPGEDLREGRFDRLQATLQSS